MKPYVRIQSNINISVTPGLQNKDVTNPDAHVPDRLKISAEWPKASYLIKAGVGIYPSVIATWPTVQNLAKDGVLTIGEELDSTNETVEQQKANLDLALDEIKAEETVEQPKKTSTKKASTKKTLEDIVGE